MSLCSCIPSFWIGETGTQVVASSFVQHLVSDNCLEVSLEWEFKVALREDVHSSGAEEAKMRSL